MSFTQPFLLGPVFFRTALPCSGGYHMERGEMPLHDAVGINCKKKHNYWKSRLSCQVYGLRGVSWWLCVLSDLTSLSILGVGRNSWYIIPLETPQTTWNNPISHRFISLLSDVIPFMKALSHHYANYAWTSNVCHGHNFHRRAQKFSDNIPNTITIFNHNLKKIDKNLITTKYGPLKFPPHKRL